MAIFNIYHVFTPFLRPLGCRFLYFFSLCHIRNEAAFLTLEHSTFKGVKRKKHEKNMTFCLLNPYYKISEGKTWLSERFSEAPTSKLWNKKIYICCRSLQKWSEIELYSPPYGYIKNLRQIQLRGNSREKIKSAIPRVQNYTTWLVKNGTIVFGKLKRKISLLISGEQANNHWHEVFLSQIFRYFSAF